MKMIRLKTAVLLAAALKIGAEYAQDDVLQAELMYECGIHIGLAFQLQDDYLDVYGDAATFGKNIGGDILAHKKTWLLIKAYARANAAQQEELDEWLQRQDCAPEEKIAAVTALYNDLNIPHLVREAITAQATKARELLMQVAAPAKRKQPLMDLAQGLIDRSR
jgi:geranylgeranyl diphosphate synthase type II